MMSFLGIPPDKFLEEASRKHMFFTVKKFKHYPKIIANSKGEKLYPGSTTLSDAIQCDNIQFLDFLSKCLEWDPKKRCTPDLACKHKWLSKD